MTAQQLVIGNEGYLQKALSWYGGFLASLRGLFEGSGLWLAIEGKTFLQSVGYDVNVYLEDHVEIMSFILSLLC